MDNPTAWIQFMSPTVHRQGSYRFYYYSREEERMHIHVKSPAGEAKFWLEPEICLARQAGMTHKELAEISKILEKKSNEFKEHWQAHFRRES